MDIVERLKGPMIPEYAQLASDVKNEIERLRSIVELIAMHPVEETKEWEIGAKEMLRCARNFASTWGWVDPLIIKQEGK